MLNKNTKPKDQIFAVIGERVLPATFLFFENNKFSKISLQNPDRDIFKQTAHCYNNERHAFEALKEKLEYHLSCCEEELARF
jgi:hypothetical protein